MRSLARFLSVLSPVVTSLPYHPRRLFVDTSNQLVNRATFKDVTQFNFEPFSITELHVLCNRPNATADYSCNLTFNWFDPNSVRQNRVTSGRCHTSWSWDGVTQHNASLDGSDPVVGYRGCWIDNETSFKAAVPSFWQPGIFSLELAHRYKDDENFTKPWDHPTTFAEVYLDISSEWPGPLDKTIYHYVPGPFNGTVVGIVD